jgi:hypothetical protein
MGRPGEDSQVLVVLAVLAVLAGRAVSREARKLVREASTTSERWNTRTPNSPQFAKS